MRTILRFVFFGIIALNTSSAFADKSELKGIDEKSISADDNAGKENKMSEKDMNQMIIRLNEIRAMDKSSLTPEQKSNLRTEVLTIKEQLHQNRPGYFIYISAATIIIILLILLLI